MNERLVVEALIAAGRLPLLEAVAALHLPDCWIAAGAVRNAVWDAAHGYVPSTPLNDVDVIWFQPGGSAADDAAIQRRLAQQMPDVRWEVKNQARMHVRQGQPPYRDSSHAMARWPETATAVAARLGADSRIELSAPHGLDDLVGLLLRPPHGGHPAFERRVADKGWLKRWPKLRVADRSDQPSGRADKHHEC